MSVDVEEGGGGGEDDLSNFRSEEEKEKEENGDKWWKGLLRFLFSWFGLALVLAAYIVGGEILIRKWLHYR